MVDSCRIARDALFERRMLLFELQRAELLMNNDQKQQSYWVEERKWQDFWHSPVYVGIRDTSHAFRQQVWRRNVGCATYHEDL